MKKVILAILFILLSEWSYSQIYKTVNVTTAGTFSTLVTSEELTSITNLVITGTINAYDLGVTSNMTSLKVLDIKNVNIAACKRFDGTPCLADRIPGSAWPINLTSIIIPTSATAIDDWALTECHANIIVDENSQYFSSLDGILFDKAKTILIQCPVTKTGILTLPSSVRKIGVAAFWDCKYLTNIIFPGALTFIDHDALSECKELTSIFIPSLVSFIGQDAFGGGYAGCKCDITVDPNNMNYSSQDGVLFDKNKTRLIKCPKSKIGNYNIPSTVISIDPNAFSYCESLTNIAIPTTVSTIGKSAFDICSKWTGDLIIPSCLLYTSDAADEEDSVDLGGRRIIK